MKVTVNWLKQYVDFAWSTPELVERLTLLGLEVESVQPVAGEFDGIVVAQVLSRDKHPNADKLSVCRVHDGQGERQIVCGAQNFQAGDKVPLILPGATLPLKPGDKEPLTIKVGKIRGVESHGMMCSPQELGLPDAIEGLLILPPDARVGQPFAEHLGRTPGDVVLDLEITPNRPDWNSVIGVAREIAALTGNPLRVPPVPSGPPAALRCSDLVSVQLDAPDLCPRYTARVLRGVKVGPSPDWLRLALEKVGLRAINNVVDVTNYVMLETGQPLHAFDYHLVAPAQDGKPGIIVRRAAPGERFTTLDNQTHVLSNEALLIADAAKGIALAGVMGGLNTEIHAGTTDVLLESAWFLPTCVRRTSKKLGLRTDASYRFERGADIGITDWAGLRAARLIQELAGGELAEGVVDAYPTPQVPRHITLRPEKVNALLGLSLRPEEMEYYLSQLGLKAVDRRARPVDAPAPSTAEPARLVVPSWRPDLKREVDLTEEIARLHGVDRIPSTPPRGAIGQNAFDAVHDDLADVRRLLTGMGLHEAQGQTLIAEAEAGAATETLVRLANPLSAEMNVLRPSLLPGLLHALRHNHNHQNADTALFELGRVFQLAGGKPQEERRVALALSGRRSAPFWQGADRDAGYDLYDMKGLVEEFLEFFGLRGVVYQRREAPTATFCESATISLGGKVILGELGLVLPALARARDLRAPALLAELRVDELLARRVPHRTLKPLPAFPSVRRDVALLVPERCDHEHVLAIVRRAKPAHLESVELFDVFRGKQVPAGQKSVAYGFTYRHAERTLTDAEVNQVHEQVVAELKRQLNAAIRE